MVESSLFEIMGDWEDNERSVLAGGNNLFIENCPEMPILNEEPDIYPENLFDNDALTGDPELTWWCVYTLSRREKDLMRKLTVLGVPHYGPVVKKRYRSPSGRLRTSFIPLFPNYVFMLCTDADRSNAMSTNCISRFAAVEDRQQLVADLKQVRAIVSSGVPLTPEQKLEAGNHVRVRSGPFAGYEGTVIRRAGKTRLVLNVHFLEQGVSVELDEAHLDPLF